MEVMVHYVSTSGHFEAERTANLLKMAKWNTRSASDLHFCNLLCSSNNSKPLNQKQDDCVKIMKCFLELPEGTQ